MRAVGQEKGRKVEKRGKRRNVVSTNVCIRKRKEKKKSERGSKVIQDTSRGRVVGCRVGDGEIGEEEEGEVCTYVRTNWVFGNRW